MLLLNTILLTSSILFSASQYDGISVVNVHIESPKQNDISAIDFFQHGFPSNVFFICWDNDF